MLSDAARETGGTFVKTFLSEVVMGMKKARDFAVCESTVKLLNGNSALHLIIGTMMVQ